MLQPDDGYYYGLGVFETIRVKEIKGILLEEHLERLNVSLKTLNIDTVIIREQVEDYIKRQGLSDGVLKICVSEKNINYSTRAYNYTSEMYQNGYKVMVSPILRNATSPLTYIKSLNYAENCLAKQSAQKHHYDEALFINTKGFISEGSASNIFFVSGDKIDTPSISCGLLPGIMRRLICVNEGVIEKEISINQIEKYDGCFLTNSIMGIMKVTSIGDVVFKQEEVIARLQKKYKEFY